MGWKGWGRKEEEEMVSVVREGVGGMVNGDDRERVGGNEVVVGIWGERKGGVVVWDNGKGEWVWVENGRREEDGVEVELWVGWKGRECKG